MLRRFRIIVGSALMAAFAVSHAQFAFSGVNATYSLAPNTGPVNWFVFTDPVNGTIDFTPNAPAFKIGGSTQYTSGSSRIDYQVSASAPVIGIDLVLQGNTADWGRILFNETVSDSNGTLGSVSGSILGANWGGSNGSFTNVYHIQFSQAVTTFSVTKSFELDMNGQGAPSTSTASINLIEQNMVPVPEPATIAALAIGAGVLLRRRRK